MWIELKRWLNYAKPYTRYFIIGPLCMIVEVIGEIVLPRIYASIIDTGVKTENVTYIVIACAIMVLTAILMMTGGIGGAYFASKASVNFAADVRRDVYAKIQRFSFANIDRFSTGSLVTRLTNDVTQVMNMINMMMRMCLRAPGMLIGALIAVNFTESRSCEGTRGHDSAAGDHSVYRHSHRLSAISEYAEEDRRSEQSDSGGSDERARNQIVRSRRLRKRALPRHEHGI